MNVAGWHGGKIVMLWIGVLLLYMVLRSAAPTSIFDSGLLGLQEGPFLVFVGAVAAAVWLTWTWLTSRERRN
jgi:hypothetical protein